MSQSLAARWQTWRERRKKAAEARLRPPLRARFRTWFERKKAAVAQAVDKPRDAEGIADRAAEKVVREGKIRKTWSDIQLLVRLVRAWARGDYRDVSRGTIALVIGALAYFVAPLDAIFDHLPLGGYIDDAAVIAWVVSEIRAELEAFKAWEAKRLLPAPPTTPPPLESPPSSTQPVT